MDILDFLTLLFAIPAFILFLGVVGCWFDDISRR
jgi:hypothetical protein